jgi:hypothetical protein
MSVLPIDLQTVISQIGNVGKMQQQQQMASMELQSDKNVRDAKDLKQKDEQIENANSVEEGKVNDALKEDGGNASPGMTAGENPAPGEAPSKEAGTGNPCRTPRVRERS